MIIKYKDFEVSFTDSACRIAPTEAEKITALDSFFSEISPDDIHWVSQENLSDDSDCGHSMYSMTNRMAETLLFWPISYNSKRILVVEDIKENPHVRKDIENSN